MKFGVNVPSYGAGASPDSIREWAVHLEALGYHHLMVSDHVAITPEVQRLFPAPFYDPFTVLAWLAGTTENIGLGTTVAILPYRHPVHLARVVANIDRLSGGRFTLGVAAGWAAGEFAALGVPYRHRGRISDEWLEVIKKCWTEDRVDFEGRYLSLRGLFTGPRPLQRPGPPIWVGGHSAGAIRRAARFGDAWHPTSVSADWLTEVGLPALREIARDLSRPTPALAPRIKLRLTDAPEGRSRVLGEGTLDQIHADLMLLDKLGAPAVILDPTYPGERRTPQRTARDLATLEILATQVVNLQRQTLR